MLILSTNEQTLLSIDTLVSMLKLGALLPPEQVCEILDTVPKAWKKSFWHMQSVKNKYIVWLLQTDPKTEAQVFTFCVLNLQWLSFSKQKQLEITNGSHSFC